MTYDWHTWVGIAASIFLLALVPPYLKSVLRGATRPSAVSWFGWALLFAIATAAQASKGIDWSLAIPLISTISTTIIACVALVIGRAVWTRADKVSIGLAALAIFLWAITADPLAAIILSMLADMAVTVPTFVKTYENPRSEPALLWVLYVAGGALEIAATRNFTLYNLLYPLYAVIGSGVIAALALRRPSPVS